MHPQAQDFAAGKFPPAQVLPPPAVGRSAYSHSSTLRNASTSAIIGLCQCLVYDSCRKRSSSWSSPPPMVKKMSTPPARHRVRFFFHERRRASVVYHIGGVNEREACSAKKPNLLRALECADGFFQLTRPGRHRGREAVCVCGGNCPCCVNVSIQTRAGCKTP